MDSLRRRLEDVIWNLGIKKSIVGQRLFWRHIIKHGDEREGTFVLFAPFAMLVVEKRSELLALYTLVSSIYEQCIYSKIVCVLMYERASVGGKRGIMNPAAARA